MSKIMEYTVRILHIIFKRLLYFGDNSNLHGIRYVTEEKRSFSCRLFWLCAMVVCAWGLREIMSGAIKSAREDALGFTPDTRRLLWQTAFPAVSVCEKYRYPKTLKGLIKKFPEFMDSYDFNYKKMFADMCFGESPCSLCSSGCDQNINCSVDWRLLADTIREPCTGLIHSCKWIEEPFDCCEYFLPIDTDSGTCYSFNTLQSSLSGSVPTMKVNRSTGPGLLAFRAYEELEVFVHGREAVPFSKTDDITFEVSDHTSFYFQIIEISNDQQVENIDLDLRKCRFPSEVTPGKFGKSYPVYGYSTCVIACETEFIFEKCKCVNHLRDLIYQDIFCNYSGLGCLSDLSEDRKKLTIDESRGLCEHCLPSCEEVELTKVHFMEYDVQDDEDASVRIEMVNTPNIQYRRNVVRTQMDLVVSIGGLAGLFFGASLLSLVEAIYYLFIRTSKTR